MANLEKLGLADIEQKGVVEKRIGELLLPGILECAAEVIGQQQK